MENNKMEWLREKKRPELVDRGPCAFLSAKDDLNRAQCSQPDWRNPELLSTIECITYELFLWKKAVIIESTDSVSWTSIFFSVGALILYPRSTVVIIGNTVTPFFVYLGRLTKVWYGKTLTIQFYRDVNQVYNYLAS